MKAKKFRVTLTVLSFATLSILKYRSKMYYWLAYCEFCSHEEDWGPWAQSPMSKSTWAESFKGSNATAKFPGHTTTSKEDVAGDTTGKRWSSCRTWHCKGNVGEPESPWAKLFALPCCCLLWCSWRWLLMEAQGCCLGCSNSPYASPACGSHISCSHSSFWRDPRSLSEGTMKSQLFSMVWWQMKKQVNS